MIGDIEDMDGGQLITFTADCLEQNGDFVLAESETGYICYKFVSTDSLTPQFYEIGSISPKTGNPTLCDVCANMLNEPIPFVFRDPTQLPVGCNIPIGCPLTNSGTPCTPEITLDGFCSELLGILEEECLESSESSSSSSSSEEVGVGAGRRAFRRRGKGKKQKGKYNSKEKCKKYEELEALIKETCE
ncbi:unnamed protein product [Mytilus edulis]|uniref:Uncharacterized protein n=1 Tax=Mytilus edulis TaxID=6550 RepID=A0A8S3VI28_MYTED|nr:unnamed protein product [Mytilus edulis]